MHDRRQKVSVDRQCSDWLPVSSGVLQGSVLGPILFLVFINDIDTDVISKLSKFADDAKLAKVVNSAQDAEILQRDLSKLEEWAKEWLMSFNTAKCKVLHLGKNNVKHEYALNGKPIGVVNSERDLGVQLTEL